MYQKLTALCIGLLLAASAASAQGYRKRLTLEVGEFSNIWICNAPSGGLYIAGFRNTSSAKYTLFLSKLNATGQLEWAKKSNPDRLGIGVTSDPQGNIYLVYEPIKNKAIEGIVVEKISPTGQTLWQKLDENNAYSLSYHALSYSNGRLYVSNTSQTKHRISAFNAGSGSVIWTNLYDSNVQAMNDNIHELLGLSDGSLLACTQIQNYNAGSYLRSLLRLDADGNVVKTKSFTGFSVTDMAELNNGNIAFSAKMVTAGSGTNGDNFIGLMTPDLDMLWIKKVSHPNLQAVEGVDAVDNGCFLACLQNPGENCLGQSVVFRIDQQGNVQWSKSIRNGSFYSIQHASMPDNGVAWVSYNPSIDTAVIVNRMDGNGDIGFCPTSVDQPFTLVDVTIPTVQVDWLKTDALTLVDAAATVLNPINGQVEDYCPSIALDASFSLSTDTVCQYQSITATPANILGNPVWVFGNNGNLGIQTTVNQAKAIMKNFGSISVMHIRSLGLCSDTVTHFVWVKPAPPADLGPDRPLCPGDTLTLESAPQPNVHYLWSTGAVDNSIQTTHAGLFDIQVIGPECSGFDTVMVRAAVAPRVSLGVDFSICETDNRLLQASVDPPGGDWLWSDGSSGNNMPLTGAGLYALRVRTGDGCIGADTVSVQIKDCPNPSVYAPNVFAPGGSAENSRWTVFPHTATILSIALYDRWGSQVFFTTQTPFEWDGRTRGSDAPAGVYAYVIRYREEVEGKEVMKTGDVTVIR